MAKKPKYERVKDTLRERIRRNSVGSKIPSIAQLHNELGVSPGTVSRAISDLVDEGILEKQPRRGTFVSRPERLTRNLGFIWPEPIERLTKHPYTGTILQGVQAEASARNRHLVVASNEEAARPALIGRGNQVAGVLVLFNRDGQLVDEYNARKVPVVLIDPFSCADGVPFVTSDHYSGMYGAATHLLRLGHQRIVHVTVDIPNCMPLEDRVRGYTAAMRDAGLEDIAHVHRVTSEPWNEVHDAAFREMIRDLEPTACCCFDDDVAAWTTRVCHESGIAVPDELSVVGYDDSGMASQTWPPMTTVRIPLEEIGRSAVRLLDELIEEHRLTGHGLVLPTELVERASTKAPSHAGQDEELSADSVTEGVAS